MKRTFIIASLFILMNIASYSADFVGYGNDWYNSLVEHKRDIIKEFSTNEEPTLKIENIFGNIRIKEGSSNKIVFKINITVKAKNEGEAKKISDKIDVEFSGEGNNIAAKTKVKSMNCNKCGYEINYEVTVPRKTKMLLENKYGNINLDNVYNALNVSLTYGNLYANEISDAIIYAKYGGANISKAEKLSVTSAYSKYKLGEIGNLLGEFKYDVVSIETSNKIGASFAYSNFTVGMLKDALLIDNFTYGTLKILGVDKSFTGIKVNAKYSKVNIAMIDGYNFKASLYAPYGSIKTGNLKFLETSIKKEDVIVGTVGTKSNSTASVNIENTYGSIVFN